MRPQRQSLTERLAIGATLLTLLGSISIPAVGLTQSTQLSAREQLQQIQFRQQTPPDLGSPSGRRDGGGHRDGCPKVDAPLTALLPGQGDQAYVSSTTTAYPVLWFYVPYALTDAHPGEMRRVEENSDGSTQERNVLWVTGTAPGIISVQVPPTERPLQVGQTVKWAFVFHCRRQTPAEIAMGVPVPTRSVEVATRRVALDSELEQRFTQAMPEEKALLYAQAGIWQESLTTLAELRYHFPGDRNIAAGWNTLLRSAALGDVAAQPIVKCCTAVSPSPTAQQ